MSLQIAAVDEELRRPLGYILYGLRAATALGKKVVQLNNVTFIPPPLGAPPQFRASCFKPRTVAGGPTFPEAVTGDHVCTELVTLVSYSGYVT